MSETKKLRQPDQNWVGCAVCLNQSSVRVPATAVINGLSTCDDHVRLVSNPAFSIFQLLEDGRPKKGAT